MSMFELLFWLLRSLNALKSYLLGSFKKAQQDPSLA